MSTLVNARTKQYRGTENSIPALLEGELYLPTDVNKIYKGTSNGNICIGDMEKLNGIALYDATCTLNASTYTLALSNAPSVLPNFFTVRFKASSTWVEGSNFVIGGKSYTASNANFNVNDVVIMNFDEISGKCFSTGSPKTVLPNNLVYATTANINLYVDVATGNDTTGDGTTGSPFATIQKAINSLPKIINHTVAINITNGTYDENVNINGFIGSGSITLGGGGSTVTQITAQYNSAYIVINNVTISTTTTHAITIISCFYVDIKNCICTTTSASFSGVYASNGGTCCVGTSTISNKSIGLYANWGATLISATNGGTNNTTVLRAYYGGTIDKASTQPSGTTAELASYGGVIK